jgi:hypothetical protein
MKISIRHTAIIVLLAIACAALGCGPSTAANAGRAILPAAPTAPAPAILTPGLPKPSVAAGHIRISDKYADIDAVYPIVSGLADEAFQSDFNLRARADIREAADSLYADAVKDYEMEKGNGFEFYHMHTLESSLETRPVNGSLLSFGVRMELYAGGAHPFPDSRFYVLQNSVPAKQLALPQLFMDPAAGAERVERLIHKAVAANPGEFFDDHAVSIGEKTWYYLTDNELHIVFPAYSIAPGAAGEPDFGFPLSMFRDILIPGVP